MTNNYESILIGVLTIILGIMGRLLLTWLKHTFRPAVRFRIIVGLFVLYTLALILMLREVYLYILLTNGTIQDYHQAAIVTVCAINIAVIFITIVYWTIRQKHRLSGDDKMKLKDM